MNRAPLYWTVVTAGLVFGAGSVLAQGFVNNGSAAMNGVTNSASYNAGVGATSGAENLPADGQLRDENGNLLVVDGLMQNGSQYSRQTGLHQSGAGYGTNTGATAIGNNLNVTVIGSWNTVIVDSEQVNNGDQNAEVNLNGDLNL
jgi:holdfast attachment protein HfaA